MDNKRFDDTLLKIIEKEVVKERWKNKFRIKGEVTNKRTTKKGSFMIAIKTAKSEYDVVIPKYKKIQFELAKNINDGDSISIVGDKKINVVFCDRIKILKKGLPKGEQTKLFA
jgi:DNA polymerase II small subunit/DNA polymerase delta subunit B